MRIRQAVAAWGLLLAYAVGMGQAPAAQLPDGTVVRVRLTADLTSSQAAVGAQVLMEVAQPVTLQGVVVIPAGAVAWGAVQDVKKGKSMHFDVEGVRLPNQSLVKLRCSAHKTNSAAKDEIKAETPVGADVGAPKGSEYVAYLDQDISVDVPAAPSGPAVSAPVAVPPPAPARPTPAPAAVAAPAPIAPPAPQPQPPPARPAPVAPPPVVSAPVAPASTLAAHPARLAPPAPPVQPGEYVRVEFYSDPLGADIMIDDEFHGSTPSILRLLPGSHQIEFRMMGYKAHSQAVNLTSGTGMQTVRITLVKQP